jgi:hypothetical protein
VTMEAIANAPTTSKGTSTDGEGLFLRGTYLGVQESRTWKPRGEDREVTIRPKLGVSVNGEELEIGCTDDAQMQQVRKGLVKGDRIELEVEALPPFGSRGAVTYTLPGVISRERRSDWK